MNHVITDKPTSELLGRAELERFMVFTFMLTPDCVVDSKTYGAFQEGWLTGLGLKPHVRLSLVLVPVGIDLENYKKKYFENLDRVINSEFSLFRGFS